MSLTGLVFIQSFFDIKKDFRRISNEKHRIMSLWYDLTKIKALA